MMWYAVYAQEPIPSIDLMRIREILMQDTIVIDSFLKMFPRYRGTVENVIRFDADLPDDPVEYIYTMKISPGNKSRS